MTPILTCLFPLPLGKSHLCYQYNHCQILGKDFCLHAAKILNLRQADRVYVCVLGMWLLLTMWEMTHFLKVRVYFPREPLKHSCIPTRFPARNANQFANLIHILIDFMNSNLQKSVCQVYICQNKSFYFSPLRVVTKINVTIAGCKMCKFNFPKIVFATLLQ